MFVSAVEVYQSVSVRMLDRVVAADIVLNLQLQREYHPEACDLKAMHTARFCPQLSPAGHGQR